MLKFANQTLSNTGAANRSATGTPVERTTRLAIPPHLPDGHGAEQVI